MYLQSNGRVALLKNSANSANSANAATLHLFDQALFTVKTPFSTIKKQCK